MNKTELITKISNITNVNKKDVKAVIDVLPNIIKETIVSGNKVALAGFITFSKKHVEAKSGTIQLGAKKGEKWEKSAHDMVSVKLSESYRTL